MLMPAVLYISVYIRKTESVTRNQNSKADSRVSQNTIYNLYQKIARDVQNVCSAQLKDNIYFQ